MRRRFFLLLSLLLAFGLGVYLAAGPFPDTLQDLWNDLLVAWYGYKLRAGSGGTVYVMVAGFLLGQGLFLLLRQLWRGPLRSARGRFADLDAASDQTTGLPSRFGLERFLDRAIRWSAGDPSTRHASLAFLQLQGLEAFNAQQGTLRGTEILQALAAIVRDGAVPLSVSGPLRWWARSRLGPRLILFGRNPPSRCPARWGGATFAIAFRGVDGRKALVVARELAADLDACVRRLAPDSGLRVRGGLCLHSTGADVSELARGALAAVEAAPPGGVAAAHQAGEGSAAMLDEFKDLSRVTVTFERSSLPEGVDERQPSGTDLAWAWVKGWGLALACIVGGPILLTATARGESGATMYPWPDNLKELPVVTDAGLQSKPLVRTAAGPVSDGTWEVAARAVQVDPESHQPSQATTFVEAAITNRSERRQRVSMFDWSAVDADGQRMRLEAKTSLTLPSPLGSRELEPGERWKGWLRFIRRGTGAKALVFHPSRESRFHLPLETAPAGAREVSATPR